MPRFELRVASSDRPGVGPLRRPPGVAADRVSPGRFWEIERRGRVLEECTGDLGTPGRRRTKEAQTEARAHGRMEKAIAVHQGRGYVRVGPSLELAPGVDAEGGGPPGSALLVDAYFVAGDARFVDEVLRFRGAEKLGALAERWYLDVRPFARQALFAYIDDGCDRPDHKALVKRIFKLAEKAQDDEAIARFLVAFDRLSRRVLCVTASSWDAVARQVVPEEGLINDLAVPARLAQGESSERFTRATRRYLARRAFRYFRRLGYGARPRYLGAMLVALPLYRDEHMDNPARLLDAWGLLHVLYGRSPVLDWQTGGVRPAKERGLGELAPAPYFPEAWSACEAELFTLLASARSRTVRSWAIAWLRLKYAAQLGEVDVARTRPLLASPYEEVQRFGAELFARARGLEGLPIADWLDLLASTNLDALAVICAAVKRHVTSSRLTLAQCVALSCARVAVVAELGLAWAREKPLATDADLEIAGRLAAAGVASVRAAGVAWCVQSLLRVAGAKSERLRDLCDSRFEDVRAVCLPLLASEPRFRDELSLWLALTESPYPDVRSFVLAHAKAWRDRADQTTLAHVWTSALVAIHGGGSPKRQVPRVVAERIGAHPEEADALLPLLGLALRSIHASERASGLVALARAADVHPGVRAAAARHFPELAIGEGVTA
jgi:hypothetical protein